MAGETIRMVDGTLTVPDHPILPFIEGDGTGRDIWRASKRVLDAAVEKAYGGERKIEWYEVLAGEKAHNADGFEWLPDETLKAFRKRTSSELKDRSPHRSVAEFVRST